MRPNHARFTSAVAGWSCLPAILAMLSSVAMADSGTIRASQRHGNVQVTVFSEPTPLVAGPVDLSVLVQDVATGEVLYPAIDIELSPRPEDSIPLHERATRTAATNKLFQAANFELPDAGWWDVKVDIDGPNGHVMVPFDFEAGQPPPTWRSLWMWFTWPFFAIALFVAFQLSRPTPAKGESPVAST
ncbi:MAG TPA: hypothetical protein VFI31_26295 [Pirellulales bacterium]|nr:hypothetical protein [Pirellulales bacterium]